MEAQKLSHQRKRALNKQMPKEGDKKKRRLPSSTSLGIWRGPYYRDKFRPRYSMGAYELILSVIHLIYRQISRMFRINSKRVIMITLICQYVLFLSVSCLFLWFNMMVLEGELSKRPTLPFH